MTRPERPLALIHPQGHRPPAPATVQTLTTKALFWPFPLLLVAWTGFFVRISVAFVSSTP